MVMQTPAMAPTTTVEDMAKSRSWVGHFVSAAEKLPVSFLYDGKEIAGIPAAWAPTRHRRRIDANLIETIFEGNDPATGLQVRVECLEYLDYPVVEWTAWFANTGDQPTPPLRDILALQGTFEGTSPVVQHCNGDFNSEDGYTPRETPLRAGDTLTLAPNGGRSCDGAFPYARIAFDGCGLTIAVGWPGQWSARFKGGDTGVSVAAGQEKTNVRLMPGERIRTPRMTIMSWTGDTPRAINLWRRWYRDHVLPRPDGRPLTPLLTAFGTDEGEEFTAATEQNQLWYMDKFKNAGFDYDVWWIDAGWYPCYNESHERKWRLTGTWRPDPERFPHGLKPVSDHAARNGADFLLWLEPERVTRDTWLFDNHPEWLLHTKEGAGSVSRSYLLDLGNSHCRQWLTDHVCTLIQDNGIKIYRQDFNFPPLAFWRDNDAEDRQGIKENLHVQGYLRFWDDLLARNPGLWIDSCASGGRRNDLETMRRSVPLHYTDYGYGIHPVKLAFHHTLYAWIPYFKESVVSWDLDNVDDGVKPGAQPDSFSFHCAMAPMLFLSIDIRKDDNDIALSKKMVGIWRRAANLLLDGDYYPLTPFSRSGDGWVAWQFDRPDTGEGLIQGIRHRACAEDRLTVYPQALDPNSSYTLENQETGAVREMAGSALLNDGFTFELPRRSGAIWFYRGKSSAQR
jgi:alpha-galactosidase